MLLEGAKAGELVQQIWCLAQHSFTWTQPLGHLHVVLTSCLCGFQLTFEQLLGQAVCML